MENNRVKQRLVGGIILVSLAVIILPLVLSERNQFELEESNIPAQPERERKVEIIPLEIAPMPEKQPEVIRRVIEEPAEVDEPAVPAEPEKVVEPAVEKAPQPPQQAAETASAPPPPQSAAPAEVSEAEMAGMLEKIAQQTPPSVTRWVVQVGSFSQEQNALGLRDRLRKNGYPAFVEQLVSQGKSVYRVRIGPEVDRDSAKRLLERLKSELKMDGMVMKHH